MNLSDLTVVLPTRNERANLPAFLASVPETISLLVVDSSTDGTADWLRQQRPRRTRVIVREVNVTQARQIGAEAAGSPWLLFTDADVMFAPDYFERLAAYAGADALYGPKLSADGRFARHYQVVTAGQRLMDRLGIPAVSGSNLLVPALAFWEVGGFDLELSCNEDSEFGWRLARRGHRLRFAPQLVVVARDHRRLQRGAARKLMHSLARCTLLYLGVLPPALRRSDWGYWSPAPEPPKDSYGVEPQL